MHCVCASDRLGAHFGQPDVTHIARLDQLGDRADRVLDRHVRIEPRGAVYVDHFGAYSLQRIGGKVLHRRRTPVETGPLAAGPAHPAELDAERRSDEHTSELQSLMRISYAV